jgi:hypothetical protein
MGLRPLKMKPLPDSWGYDLAASGEALASVYRLLEDDRQRVRGQRLQEAAQEWLQRNRLPIRGEALAAAVARLGVVDDSVEAERRVLMAAHLSVLSLTLGNDMLGGHRLVIQSAEAMTQARVVARALPYATAAIRTAFDAPAADDLISESAMEGVARVLDAIREPAMTKHRVVEGEVVEAIVRGLQDRAEAVGLPDGWSADPTAREAAS